VLCRLPPVALPGVDRLFLQCAGDHRDLHSFPTRRSSDLDPRPSAQGRHVDAFRPACASWMPATAPCDFTNAAIGAHASRCSSLRSEEHTSELQSREKLVCRLLLEKKKRLELQTVEHHPLS